LDRPRVNGVKEIMSEVEEKNEEVVDQKSAEDVETTEAAEKVETNESVESVEENVEENKAAKKAKKKLKKIKKDPLKESEAKVAELNDKLLRLHAEYDNFRKRTAKDLRNNREAGVVDTIMPFLQVYDHMKMAAMSIENGDNIDAIRQGVTMILNEFQRAVADLSVDEINAIGSDFDPNLHAAVAHESSDEVEEGKVLKQWSPGYRKGERLIKPAKVVVSSGPEAAADAEESTEEEGEE